MDLPCVPEKNVYSGIVRYSVLYMSFKSRLIMFRSSVSSSVFSSYIGCLEKDGETGIPLMAGLVKY